MRYSIGGAYKPSWLKCSEEEEDKNNDKENVAKRTPNTEFSQNVTTKRCSTFKQIPY
jgi:hypothetical protein